MMSKQSLLRIALAVLAVTSFLGASLVQAAETKKAKPEGKEQKLTQKDLPAAVATAFQTAYPKAIILGVSKETEDSTTYYEIKSVDAKVNRTVEYSADGKLAEIEEAITEKELPEAALAAIAKDYPKGKIEKAEKATKGDVSTFEVKVLNGKDRVEVVFDTSGKVIKTEQASHKRGKH